MFCNSASCGSTAEARETRAPAQDVACKEVQPYWLLCARTVAATTLPFAGLGALAAGLLGALPDQVPPVLVIPFCLLSLAAYCYELSRRHAWAVARTFWTGQRFTASMEAMRDAAPLMDLQLPGQKVSAYELAQWRDETRWFDFGPEVQRGLLLVTFPLEFIPGDRSEALALDNACTSLLDSATTQPPSEADPALGLSCTELRLRLRWPDGLESDEPSPRLLHAGEKGAEWPYPGLVFLACLFLVGLCVDLILVSLAEPVEWPIRKRFFTREAGRLGTLTFSCSAEGVVAVDGDAKELRTANRFWIKNDTHWQAVESEVSGLGPDLIRYRWLRRVGHGLAVLLVVTVGGRLFLTPGRLPPTQALLQAFACALGSVACWGLGPLADCLAQRRVRAASERLGSLLPGGATVTASWMADPALAQRDLSIEVEQPSPGVLAVEELPVLRSSSTLMKSNSAALFP